jgi:hypothetical protein
MTMGGLTFYGCLASQDHRSKARNRIVKSVLACFLRAFSATKQREIAPRWA